MLITQGPGGGHPVHFLKRITHKIMEKNILKITIDQLKNYLGTGLKFYADDYYSDEYGTVLELIDLIGLNSFGFIEGRLPDFETVTETFEIEQVRLMLS